MAVSPHVVSTVNETWGVACFVARHVRWGQLRRRISPLAYLAEPLLNPVPWMAVLLALAAAGASLGPLSSGALAALAVAGVAAKVASDAILVSRLRGKPMALAHLALVPAKDLLVAGIWLVAAFRRTVDWRGTTLRIGPGSRLLPPRRAAGRAAATARARRPRAAP